LRFAAAFRNDTAAVTLLSLGADSKYATKVDLGRNIYQVTPLHFAISLHLYDIAEILLKDENSSTFQFRDTSKIFSTIRCPFAFDQCSA
jgi:hypothetical protein